MTDKIQNQIQDLLQKEMSRKEFLTTLGLGILSLVGISSVLQMLSHKGKTQQQEMGYGSSVYGGLKNK